MNRPNHKVFSERHHTSHLEAIDEMTVQDVQSIIDRRNIRSRHLPSILFSEPGWEMLIFLALRKLQQQRVTIRETCSATTAPYSTAWRWLERLTNEGLVIQRDDPLDARRKFVELTPDALRRVSMTVMLQRQIADQLQT